MHQQLDSRLVRFVVFRGCDLQLGLALHLNELQFFIGQLNGAPGLFLLLLEFLLAIMNLLLDPTQLGGDPAAACQEHLLKLLEGIRLKELKFFLQLEKLGQ